MTGELAARAHEPAAREADAASGEIARLREENARLRDENAALRGEGLRVLAWRAFRLGAWTAFLAGTLPLLGFEAIRIAIEGFGTLDTRELLVLAIAVSLVPLGGGVGHILWLGRGHGARSFVFILVKGLFAGALAATLADFAGMSISRTTAIDLDRWPPPSLPSAWIHPLVTLLGALSGALTARWIAAGHLEREPSPLSVVRLRAVGLGARAALFTAAVPALTLLVLVGGSGALQNPAVRDPETIITLLWISVLEFLAFLIPLAAIGGAVGLLLCRFARRDSRRRLMAQGLLFGGVAPLPVIAAVFEIATGGRGVRSQELLGFIVVSVFASLCGSLAGVRTARFIAEGHLDGRAPASSGRGPGAPATKPV